MYKIGREIINSNILQKVMNRNRFRKKVKKNMKNYYLDLGRFICMFK